MPGFDLPSVEDLSTQWHDGLELAITGLFGGAACGIAFDQEEFGSLDILNHAIGKLPWKGGSARGPFARDLFAGAQTGLGIADGEFRDPVAGIRVLIQP